jgi:hypothetical protein
MKDQIFISHSREDRQIVQYFLDKFDDTGVKPVLMEFEKWSRNGKPNWIWIRDEIKKSKALFLLLTKSIIRKQQTQNWVSFEIGLTSMCVPSIPVFIFKEERVDFPIPYPSHYFDQSFSKKTNLFTKDFSETLLNVYIHVFYESFIDELIKDPNIGLADDETIECSKCFLKFHYWGENKRINCPCCSTDIKISDPGLKNILDSTKTH